MRASLVTLLLSALFAALPLAGAEAQLLSSIGEFATRCQADDEIPAADRKAIDAAALHYVHAIFGADPAAAYDDFAAAARRGVSRAEFAAKIKAMVAPMTPFSDLQVTHRYLLVTNGGSGFQKAPCEEQAHQPAQVMMSVAANATQAYVTLDARQKEDGWAAVAWLMLEQGDWHVLHFQINVARLAGRTALALSDAARRQRQQRHDLNAYLLYAASFALAYRGPNFELPLQQEVDRARKTLPVPVEFAGKPPFTWKYGSASFTIRKAGPTSVGKQLYLVIVQLLPSWQKDEEADSRNRRLANAFALAHPDYKDAFAGLVVEAEEEHGTRAVRTVIDAQEGEK